MHELAVTRNIVAIVAEKAGQRPVRRVRLQVGRLSGIEVSAVRFCYDVCVRGTMLEGSDLEIEEIDGRATCLECKKDVAVDHFTARCPCEQRARVQITQGEELLIKEMEVRP